MDATKRPAVVTIAAIVLIVLALFVAGLGIANQFGLFGRAGFGNRVVLNGQTRNRNFLPQNGFPQNGFNNNRGTTPNYTPNRTVGTGLISLYRLIGPITLGLDIALLILAVVASIGLFKVKRWAAILSIVIAVLLILLTITGMLRIFSAVTLVENLIRILLAVAVIVLLLLPSARRSFARVMDDELDMEL
jgi:heme A synthase